VQRRAAAREHIVGARRPAGARFSDALGYSLRVPEDVGVRDEGSTRSNGEVYPATVRGMTFRQLLSIMREDWEAHDRDATRAGLHALLLHRYATWRLGLPPGTKRKALSAARHALWTLVRNVYGIEVHDTATIGRRVVIGHQGAVVIDGEAVIGDDCLIHHNVTIGRAEQAGGAPRIGRDVVVGPGAVVIGDITVGDRARIGPNAVVVVDVPADGAAFAPPARQIHPKSERARRETKDE
jgi:serine O-acetyltransferase